MVAKPWSVQYEVVEGCNFRCWFCGIHSIRGKENNYKCMDIGLARESAQELNRWLGKVRIELNNHGEPTVHPQFFDLMETIKTEFPKSQIQLQTNGYGFFPQLQSENDFELAVDTFFGSGGNLLVLNCYRKGFYEFAMERLEKLSYETIDFYYDNPENQSAYRYYGPSVQKVFVFQDLGLVNVEKLANKRLAKKILNEGGNSPANVLEAKLGIPPVKEPLRKGCSRVFRELTIGWDGVIPACCYDWKNDLVFGKFPESSLQDIWEGPKWEAARVLLHPRNSERRMKPCDVCDYNGGFRLGLLQYPESSLSIPEAYSRLT